MVSSFNYGGLGCSNYLHTRTYKVCKQLEPKSYATILCVLTLGSSGAGFAVLRFITGLAEAPFFPGITLSGYNFKSLPTNYHALDEADVSQ